MLALVALTGFVVLAACTTARDTAPEPSTTTSSMLESTPTAVVEEAEAPYLNPDLAVEERVEDLIGRMTLEEKVAQMSLVQKSAIAEKDLGVLPICA